MRQRGPEKSKEHRERIAMLRRTSHGPERCQWPYGCANEAVDADERLLRSQGGSITDRDNLQLLCRTHHDWKHAHPVQAEAMGVYERRGRCTTVAQPCNVPSVAERKHLAVRIGPGADQFITDLAATHNTTRTIVVRAMLAAAADPKLRTDVTRRIRLLVGAEDT